VTVQRSAVQGSKELFGELVRELHVNRQLLLFGSWWMRQGDSFGTQRKGTSAVGSRYHATTGEDTAD
jgi:hypothetical protein